MFSHIMVGSNDIQASKRFYDAALGAIGHDPGTLMGEDGPVLYRGKDGGTFMVVKPRDGEPATHANGGTIGFVVDSRNAVDDFHAAGLANGGIDEGAAGPRDYMPGAYAAYLRDPVGNKICAFIIEQQG